MVGAKAKKTDSCGRRFNERRAGFGVESLILSSSPVRFKAGRFFTGIGTSGRLILPVHEVSGVGCGLFPRNFTGGRPIHDYRQAANL